MSTRQFKAGLLLLAFAALVATYQAGTARATEYVPGDITDAYVRKWAMHAEASPSTATQTELVAAPGAGKRIYVISIDVQAEGTQTFELESGTTDLTSNYEISDGDYWSKGPFRCGANEALNITTSASAVINVSVTYVIQ